MFRWKMQLSVVAALCVVAGLLSDQPPAKPAKPAKVREDMTKRRVVERPVEAVVKVASKSNTARLDRTKGAVIEPPAKAVVRSSAPASDVNPRVEAGKVKWHATFADACKAAENTRRPVLLLHMMGELDRQFC